MCIITKKKSLETTGVSGLGQEVEKYNLYTLYYYFQTHNQHLQEIPQGSQTQNISNESHFCSLKVPLLLVFSIQVNHTIFQMMPVRGSGHFLNSCPSLLNYLPHHHLCTMSMYFVFIFIHSFGQLYPPPVFFANLSVIPHFFPSFLLKRFTLDTSLL